VIVTSSGVLIGALRAVTGSSLSLQ